MTEPLLALDDLSFGYDADRPVLRGATLQLRPGQRLGMIGSNGSGKTTLLHLMVGLLEPTGGCIRAFGQVCRREADFVKLRRRVGLLFQDPDDQLFCPTVLEDVAFGPLNLGLRRDEAIERCRRTLSDLDMAGYESRITWQLSAGEKKLIALAGVLAMRPDVLLLDEPSAGLDEHHEQRVIEILANLDQAMLIVSHDRQFLGKVATGTVELRDGTMHGELPAG